MGSGKPSPVGGFSPSSSWIEHSSPCRCVARWRRTGPAASAANTSSVHSAINATWTASFLDVYAITYAIASGEDPTRAGPRPRGGLASVRHADRGPPECIGETAEVYVHALDVKTAVFTITLWPIACSTSD